LGSHSLSIAPFLGGLPGIGSGSTSPVSLRLFSQRFMVGIETEKVLATSSLGVPASTVESTLNLRSFEYGFIPGAYHIRIDTYGSRCQKVSDREYIPCQGGALIGRFANRPYKFLDLTCRQTAGSDRGQSVRVGSLCLSGFSCGTVA